MGMKTTIWCPKITICRIKSTSSNSREYGIKWLAIAVTGVWNMPSSRSQIYGSRTWARKQKLQSSTGKRVHNASPRPRKFFPYAPTPPARMSRKVLQICQRQQQWFSIVFHRVKPLISKNARASRKNIFISTCKMYLSNKELYADWNTATRFCRAAEAPPAWPQMR